jgi:hypothetical protein
MTRVLLTYASTGERGIAARRAVRLTRRGVDVDIAPCGAAVTRSDGAYDHVLDVRSADPTTPTTALPAGEGVLRIVGARVEASTASASSPNRPAWIGPTAIALGVILVAGGASVGVPVVLLVVYALALAAASTCLFGALHLRLARPTRRAAPLALMALSSRHTGAA